MDFTEMITTVVTSNASDLHVAVGAPPVMRVSGDLRAIGRDVLTPQDTRELLYGILTQDQRRRLETDLELDFSYQAPGLARFRVNAYHQRGVLGAALRIVPTKIRSLDDLKIPGTVGEWSTMPRGLVLVTGATGSGKSTTLAGLIDLINETRSVHIMTIEDPIEFLHNHKRSLINQRELGGDTRSFASALRSALRQDPDVILLGEMRDLETIQIALTAAETGHLVLGTLHTSDAPQTIDRVIDVFPVRAAGAGARDARQLAPGRRVPAAVALHRGRSYRRVRGARRHRGRAQPDPGGQDPPDLLDHADRCPARHAVDECGARGARARGADPPGRGARALEHAGRAAAADGERVAGGDGQRPPGPGRRLIGP